MTDQPRLSDHLAGPITFALLILIALLAIRSIEPPTAVDENAPATEFSSGRATRDVREIAKQPHPLGSAENVRVREYLVGRLRELGANPEVQTATAARHSPFGPDTWAVVHNIAAKIPGTQSTGAVMMVAHYDSVRAVPARATTPPRSPQSSKRSGLSAAGPALRNDLIILFTDGDELGLLGAQGFVDLALARPRQHQGRVGTSRMRGDEGPSMVFQTSPRDSWQIDQFAATAPSPRGSRGWRPRTGLRGIKPPWRFFPTQGWSGPLSAVGDITRDHTQQVPQR